MLKSIGKWQIYPLETGDFRLDGGAMMGSVPKVLWEKTNPPDELNRIDLSLRCLLLDDGKQKILIETGMGNKIENSFIKRFHVQQAKHPLKKCLHDIGVGMDDITHVLLTHLHFDHAGGATMKDGLGSIVPSFPNAIYYVSERNWEAGQNPSPRDQASYLNCNYNPLQDADQLQLVPENTEILDGIFSLVVNGHTYGQQLIKIEDGSSVLIFCADLIPLKSHIQLPWIMGYDLNAVLTLQEKTSFLKDASDNNWWLWLYHDPKVIAIRIKTGKKYYDVVEEMCR